MRALSVVVAVLGLGAGAALYVVGSRPGPAFDAAPLVAEVDNRLREVAAGLHARTLTLAEIPILASAVSTDEATVRNLTQDELAFRPRAGETITIAQVAEDGGKVPKGTTTVLLRLPDGAPAASVKRPGTRIAVVNGQLMLVEVVNVQPRERAAELHGALGLSWQVDLSAFQSKLSAQKIQAVLETEDGSLSLGPTMPLDGAIAVTQPLTSEPGRGAKLVLQTPPPVVDRTLPIAGGAVAFLGLVIAGLLARRRAPEPAPERDLAGGTGVQPAVNTTSLGMGGSSVAVAAVAKSATLSSSGEPGLRQVGRYTIIRPLGQGGMAEVFLARSSGEAGFEKLVALKVLHRQLASQPIVVEHFLDEARLASRLTHPNVVQIIDLGKADDEYFIAMEYIEGADLERLLELAERRGAPVPLPVALTIVRRICDGLHSAHTAVDSDGKPLDLVHRDVKAANVFVAKNGVVKVGDFGIAKANLASRVNRTEVGQVKGTAAYMSPEHRIGRPVDRRADLYAVGAIAYELFTGTFINLDLERLAVHGREGWPHLTPMSQLRPELPPELDAIVWKALSYERDDRYADCAEMEAALEEVANRHPPIASDKTVAQWVERELAVTPASQAHTA